MTQPSEPFDDELDALLAPGRLVPDADPGRQARALNAIRRRVAAAPPPLAAPAPPAPTAPVGAPAWSLGAGGLLIGLAIGVTATVLLLPALQPTVEPTPSPPATPPVVEVAPSSAGTPGGLVDDAIDDAAPPSATPLPHTTRPAPRGRSERAPRADAPTPADELLAERRIVDAALAQLRRGHPADALQSVARHEARFPRGQLIEARELVRIRALVALNRREEARASLARFEDRFAGSATAASLSRLLAED